MPRTTDRPPRVGVLSLVMALAILSIPARGQINLESTRAIDFDRPESWAMKYFTAVSLPTALGPPESLERGDVTLALEAGWIPSISEEKRRVGFLGSKVEDLNRSSVFGRLRGSVGLPAGLELSAGATIPVEVDGVSSELYSLALAWSFAVAEKWRIGGRIFGQTGSINGDLTCPADVAGSEDPEINPDACISPSDDEMEMGVLGVEAHAGWANASGRLRPYFSLGAAYLDLAFQIRAEIGELVDRDRLETEGWIMTSTAGVAWCASERWEISGELFYAPLQVVRDPARGQENDGLFNVRFQTRFRIP